MHTQVGFDLRSTKHYGSPEMAQKMVEKALAGYIADGACFNILVVAQRTGGHGTDAEDLRYIPLLNCFRGTLKSGLPIMQVAVAASRLGFTVFA